MLFHNTIITSNNILKLVLFVEQLKLIPLRTEWLDNESILRTFINLTENVNFLTSYKL